MQTNIFKRNWSIYFLKNCDFIGKIDMV